MQECPLCKGDGVIDKLAKEHKFRKEEMIKLRGEGLTFRAIGRLYGLQHSHVHKIINSK